MSVSSVQRLPFEKILVANRGEIALRIIRACHELGIKTVAIHSTADVDALHVKLATESICIGPPPAKQSYLHVPAIIAAAAATQADAIHPGYGFLSENAAFAEICGSCGITFVGPTVRNMRIMGDKARARRAAERAGVPTIPGESNGFLDADDALEVAKKIGFPILLKACAGGGGRGMKIVHDSETFAKIFRTAQAEVEAAFGNGAMLVEKLLAQVRHVEVQIVGDRFGNVVHLGVRDCSMQRRYQKVIEESPSPGLDDDVRCSMEQAAVELGRSVGYASVGTVEFLVDLSSKSFYFIEMNTRLQVEHPVTEMVTDTDVVKEQIRLAAGQELSMQQSDVHFNGHAIEVRINAEDPRKHTPSPGLITSYHPPGGKGVRVDSAIYSGYTVQPFYDSLISKLIVHDRSRVECIRKMLVALDEYMIDGISTNIELHRRILSHDAFREGRFHTKFLDENDLFAEEQ